MNSFLALCISLGNSSVKISPRPFPHSSVPLTSYFQCHWSWKLVPLVLPVTPEGISDCRGHRPNSRQVYPRNICPHPDLVSPTLSWPAGATVDNKSGSTMAQGSQNVEVENLPDPTVAAIIMLRFEMLKCVFQGLRKFESQKFLKTSRWCQICQSIVKHNGGSVSNLVTWRVHLT